MVEKPPFQVADVSRENAPLRRPTGDALLESVVGIVPERSTSEPSATVTCPNNKVVLVELRLLVSGLLPLNLQAFF